MRTVTAMTMAVAMVAGLAVGQVATKDSTAEELVRYCFTDSTAVREGAHLGAVPLDVIKNTLVKVTIAQLVREGKTIFVQPDGTDNVKDRMADAVAALNRPLYQGLIEAIYKLRGEEFDAAAQAKLIPSQPTWNYTDWCAHMTELAETDMNAAMSSGILGHTGTIRITLGVEGYNRFIEEYNAL
jgi:hypothetical protein